MPGSERTRAVSDAADPPPQPKPKRRFGRLRRVGLELLVLALVFFGLGLWQTRGLLPRNEPVPELELVDLQGKRVSLADYRGKTLLVHFWATWCGVCRQEFAALNAIQRNLGRDEVLLSVVADSAQYARVEGFAREHRLEYPVLLATQQVLEDYKIDAFPTNYYVDGAGKLRDKTVGLSTRMSMGARMACAK
jgi:thiol-disulfide isomerase/thioredoxin